MILFKSFVFPNLTYYLFTIVEFTEIFSNCILIAIRKKKKSVEKLINIMHHEMIVMLNITSNFTKNVFQFFCYDICVHD